MDEKGFMIGKLQKTKRIFNLEHWASGKLRGAGEDGNREWITLIACICADGQYLPPCIIYSAKTGNLQTSWIEDFDPKEHTCHFASTEKGWTNDALGFKWLEIFDRYTKAKARQGRDWRVLWVDGHGSHLSMDFLLWSIEHRIHIAVYPSHSTHRLQPLDIGLFSPLSSYYSTSLSDFIAATRGYLSVGKREFFALFWPAFQKAFSEKNIHSAWAKSGLWPWDADSVLDPLKPDHFEVTNPDENGPSTPPPRPITELPLNLRWREMRKAVDEAGRGPTYSLIERLQAENQILKHQVNAYESVFKHKERRKKKGRAVFELEEGETAGWYSPQKVLTAQQRLQQRDEEEQLQRELKEQEKLRKRQAKEEKEREIALRKQQREQARKEKAELKARKQAEKEEMARSKRAVGQPQSGPKPTNQRQKNKDQHQVRFNIGESSNNEGVQVPVQKNRTSRSGRSIKQPRYLNDYET